MTPPVLIADVLEGVAEVNRDVDLCPSTACGASCARSCRCAPCRCRSCGRRHDRALKATGDVVDHFAAAAARRYAYTAKSLDAPLELLDGPSRLDLHTPRDVPTAPRLFD